MADIMKEREMLLLFILLMQFLVYLRLLRHLLEYILQALLGVYGL